MHSVDQLFAALSFRVEPSFFWSMSSLNRSPGRSSFSMCWNLCGTTLGMDAGLPEQHGEI